MSNIFATIIITLIISAIIIANSTLGIIASGVCTFALILNKDFRGKF